MDNLTHPWWQGSDICRSTVIVGCTSLVDRLLPAVTVTHTLSARVFCSGGVSPRCQRAYRWEACAKMRGNCWLPVYWLSSLFLSFGDLVSYGRISCDVSPISRWRLFIEEVLCFSAVCFLLAIAYVIAGTLLLHWRSRCDMHPTLSVTSSYSWRVAMRHVTRETVRRPARCIFPSRAPVLRRYTKLFCVERTSWQLFVITSWICLL